MIYLISWLLLFSFLANIWAAVFLRLQLDDLDHELAEAYASLQTAHREIDLQQRINDRARTAGRRDRRMHALGLIEGARS